VEAELASLFFCQTSFLSYARNTTKKHTIKFTSSDCYKACAYCSCTLFVILFVREFDGGGTTENDGVYCDNAADTGRSEGGEEKRRKRAKRTRGTGPVPERKSSRPRRAYDGAPDRDRGGI